MAGRGREELILEKKDGGGEEKGRDEMGVGDWMKTKIGMHLRLF